MPISDKTLKKTFTQDQELLATTKIPIITVSGTYHEDLKGLHHLEESDLIPDVVYSRAHYSMAIGVAVEAWETAKKKTIDPKLAWMVDPANYVDVKEEKTLAITETIGKLLARQPMLKRLKDLVDKFGRSKLPILASITPPLLKLTKDSKGPFLSFHIAAGNILLENGKTVVQMITDPHVREDYITHAEKDHAFYLVFDNRTKKEFMEKAEKLGIKANADRVFVTGPPIDPRIIHQRENKKAWTKERPLRLAITTGGLGTNKVEIKNILNQLVPKMASQSKPSTELLVYAGTHADIKDMVIEKARKHDLPYREISLKDPAHFEIGKKLEVNSARTDEAIKKHHVPLTVIYHPQIIDANELLIEYGFPWADGFISKPSGDMAYDAVAAGCFLLTLAEWGEWELNIREKFEGHGVSIKADVDNILEQLSKLKSGENNWINKAMKAVQTIEEQDPLLLKGSENIIKAFKKIS